MLIASNALAFSYFARYTLTACDVGEQTRGRKVTGSVFVFSWYKILLLSTSFFQKRFLKLTDFEIAQWQASIHDDEMGFYSYNTFDSWSFV